MSALPLIATEQRTFREVRCANNGSGGMFALSLRIAQPLARENAIFGGGHLSQLRLAERFQHFKDMIGKLSLSAFRPP